jgi:hypothetical protein
MLRQSFHHFFRIAKRDCPIDLEPPAYALVDDL